MDKTQELAASFNAVGVDFILTELDTGITLCDVALSSRRPEHAEHDASLARQALQVALRFKKRFRLDRAEQREVAEKTSHLQSLLKQLDKRVKSSARHS